MNACHFLTQFSSKDRDLAVDALVGALGDRSENVRNAAVTALGEIGSGAVKAVPRVIDCYRHDSCSSSAIIKAIGRIGPDSTEAVDFLIEVVRNGKNGSVRPMDERKGAAIHRREAIQALAKIGPKASKAIPVLINTLSISGNDIIRQLATFETTAEALGFIGAGDEQVRAALQRFQQGKGLHVKDNNSPAVKRAILAADSAVKRLAQAEEASAPEKEKGEHK
jgi:HEAT repeat protein